MSDKTWHDQLPQEFVERLQCGSVFHTHVDVALVWNRCIIFSVMFLLNEGLGVRRMLKFANDHKGKYTIPEQVEMLMMDIDCAPTWVWTRYVNHRYVGQFAHYRNYKVVGDSGASRFDLVL